MTLPTPDLLADMHLLRPEWLWTLLALPPALWFWSRRRQRASIWRSAVDPHLLPHLVEGASSRRGQAPAWLASLAYVLAVLALSGPSWRQAEQPLWEARMPLVVAVDLSRAMLATDLPPSRLAQVRAKLAALLRERKGGQVGLVAFADDAFTVTPVTADAANVAIFLDALHPDVMPIDGQRPDRAIELAVRLLGQAGFEQGQVLLVTDSADRRAADAAGRAHAEGFTVSALGTGRPEGGDYTGIGGGLSHARLDAASLQRLVAQGGGRYAELAADNADLAALGVLDPTRAAVDGRSGVQGRTWVDEGYWLLPPLMLLSAWAFRRRVGVAVMVLALALTVSPVRARAAEGDWWQRADQARHERLRQGTEAYRAGDYERAAGLYRQVDSADGHYNRGNALARAGDYEGAIAAYDRALKLQPGMPDALANRQAVQAAMQRQPPSGGGEGRSNDDAKQDGDSGEPQPGDANPDTPPKGGPNDSASEPSESSPQDRDEEGDPAESESGAQAQDEARAEAQRQADAAQRERMQRALERSDAGQQADASQVPVDETPEQREQRLANEAWLRRVPDDPGGLLREKFRLEHERRRIRGLREDYD